MNLNPKDILLDNNDDLKIVNGDFVLGNSLRQEVGIILRLKQGELKSDPLLGVNIIRFIRSVNGIKRAIPVIKKHLKRDGKDYEKIKELIQLNG